MNDNLNELGRRLTDKVTMPKSSTLLDYLSDFDSMDDVVLFVKEVKQRTGRRPKIVFECRKVVR